MHSGFFESKPRSLTYREQKTLNQFSKYGLTAAHILQYDWLQNYQRGLDKQVYKGYRLKAFAILLDQGHSLGKILPLITVLSADQIHGICQGLSIGVVEELNANQIDAILKFNLEKEDVLKYSWLTIDYIPRLKMFSRLLTQGTDKKNALEIVDQLTSDEIYGIERGLEITEVKGLDYTQVFAMLRYALTKDEVTGLDQYQLLALHRLKSHGLEKKHLIQKPINSYYHFKALSYLMVVNKKPAAEAIIMLHKLSPTVVKAISYGMELNQVDGLPDDSIDILISLHKQKWITSRKALEGLTKAQINAVNELSHLGLSAEIIKNDDIPNSEIYLKTLAKLMVELSYTAEQGLNELKDLQDTQIELIAMGLSRTELLQLKHYQAEALATYRNTKNKLSVEFFNNNWFSESHFKALKCLRNRDYTLEEAMQILEKLTPIQAERIANSNSLDDIHIELTHKQQYVVDMLKYHRFSLAKEAAHYFHQNKTVLSKDEAGVLLELIVKDHYLVEEAAALIAGLHEDQLPLIRNYDREVVLSLNRMQIALLQDNDLLESVGKDQIIAATWLTILEQYNLLLLLHRSYFSWDCFDIRKEIKLFAAMPNQTTCFALYLLERLTKLGSLNWALAQLQNSSVIDFFQNIVKPIYAEVFLPETVTLTSSKVIIQMNSTDVNDSDMESSKEPDENDSDMESSEETSDENQKRSCLMM